MSILQVETKTNHAASIELVFRFTTSLEHRGYCILPEQTSGYPDRIPPYNRVNQLKFFIFSSAGQKM